MHLIVYGLLKASYAYGDRISYQCDDPQCVSKATPSGVTATKILPLVHWSATTTTVQESARLRAVRTAICEIGSYPKPRCRSIGEWVSCYLLLPFSQAVFSFCIKSILSIPFESVVVWSYVNYVCEKIGKSTCCLSSRFALLAWPNVKSYDRICRRMCYFPAILTACVERTTARTRPYVNYVRIRVSC